MFVITFGFMLLAVTYGAPTPDPQHCPMICPFIYLPLCGSNGQTYSNDCDLKVYNCLHKASVTMLHQGECPQTTTETTTTDTVVVTTPLPTLDTHCPMICPLIYFPVCGTNGRTYGNECNMKVDSCLRKTKVTKLHDGSCSSTEPDDAPGH